MRSHDKRSKVYQTTILAVCVFLTLQLSNHAAQPSSQWASDFEAGVHLMRQGRFQESINTLTKAIADNPQDMRARRQRAIAYHHAGMYKESIADAEYVLKQPRLPRYFRGWALQHGWVVYRILVGKKPPLELVSSYSKDPVKRSVGYCAIVPEIGADNVIAAIDKEIEDSNGKCAELIFTRARINLERKKPELAINDWKHVAKSPASSLNGILLQAHAYQLLSQHEQAIRLCDQAIDRDNKFCAGYEFRGLVRSCQGRWKEAEADYSRALALDPSDIEAYRGRAHARTNLGEFDGALDDTAKVLQMDQFDSYVLRAHIYEQKGQLKNALTAISVVAKNSDKDDLLAFRNSLLIKAIQQGSVTETNIRQFLDPQHLGNTALLVGGATIANFSKKHKLAYVIANDVLAKQPSSVGALIQKGLATAAMEDSTQAIKCCNKALALKHTASDEVMVTHVKALILEQNGKQTEISRLWTKLIQKFPKEPGAYEGRAVGYKKRKKYPEALVDIQKAVKLDPTLSNYWTLNIDLLRSMERPPEEIIKLCTEAIKRFPNDKQYYEIRAESYRKLGDEDHELEDREQLKQLRLRDMKR